ncbi:5'-methylthioadenosine phosphorylase, partial [Kitasatospora sp. NPDC127059]
GDGVTHAEVLEVFAGNVDRLRTVLFKALEALPAVRECPCPHALDGLTTGLPGVPGR